MLTGIFRCIPLLLFFTVVACGDDEGVVVNRASTGCRLQLESLQECGLRGEGYFSCYDDVSAIQRCVGECDAASSCAERNSCDDLPCFWECLEKIFECGSGESIFLARVCDGAVHCADGSDEEDCEVVTFRCEDGSGEPLSGSVVCDGERDCADGSDEKCAEKLVPCENP